MKYIVFDGLKSTKISAASIAEAAEIFANQEPWDSRMTAIVVDVRDPSGSWTIIATPNPDYGK